MKHEQDAIAARVQQLERQVEVLKAIHRNRERINIVADEKGGAQIRFLDRRTSVASRMYLDDQNQVWLSFSDFTRTPPLIRRYGLRGEETVQPRQ